MSLKSAIEWTESTWNPVTGCTKVSPGCKHCYAERMAKRLKAMGSPNYENGFELTTHDHAVELPLGWKKPQLIFVNSMSDLFHPNVPDDFILKIFDTMNRAHWHTFQILTKRSQRLPRLNKKLNWTENIWMGVSVENDRFVSRIRDLKKCDAFLKFLSLEPLLGPLKRLPLKGVDWVIAGGESGPGARPMKPEWVRDVRNQCLRAEVPFFFKQWGGFNKKKNGRTLDNRTWDEVPDKAKLLSIA